MKVDHSHVFVKNFEKNLEFLSKTLKFPVVGVPVDRNLNLRLLRVGPDLIELVDEKQFPRKCKTALLVDNIEKELGELRKKGAEVAEMTEISVAKWREGEFRYVLLRMIGDEKFDGDWVELVEKGEWKP